MVVRSGQVRSTKRQELTWLDSYETESAYYAHLKSVDNLTTPSIYFHHADRFNQRFAMLMEDVSGEENGQPLGFSYEASSLLVRSVASLHAAHWNETDKDLPPGSKVWSLGKSSGVLGEEWV